MIAVPGTDRGGVVPAVVVLRGGFVPSDALARERREFVEAGTAPHKYPRLAREICGSGASASVSVGG